MNSGIEQPAIAGRPIVSDSTLQHVPDVVELVTGRLRLRKHSQRLAIILIVSIQVAAGFLNGNYLVDKLLGTCSKLRTIARLQHESNRLGPLVNIGVRKHGANLRSSAFAHEAAEIIHAAVRLQQVVHGGDALGYIDLAALTPEAAGDRHRTHRNVPQFGVRGLGKIFHTLIFPARRVCQCQRCLRRRLSAPSLSEDCMSRQRRNGSRRNCSAYELSARDVYFFRHALFPISTSTIVSTSTISTSTTE